MSKAEARTVAAQDVPPVVVDEPLDAIQQALVRLWVKILADEIRAEVAAEIRDEQAAAAANQVGASRHVNTSIHVPTAAAHLAKRSAE